MSKTYRKLPIPVEVMQFTGDNGEDIVAWANGAIQQSALLCSADNAAVVQLFINTLEGTMKAVPGSYIVKGNAGEFWAVKKEIFEVTYEEV